LAAFPHALRRREQPPAFISALPLPRGASPAEAAKAYECSMLNGDATGQALPVDGGGLVV